MIIKNRMFRLEYTRIEDLESNPAAAWLNGSLFCEREWLSAIAGMGRGEVGIWTAYRDAEPVAIAPVLWRRTTLGRMAFLPALTPYWGFAFKPDADDDMSVKVLHGLVKHYTGFRISLPPDHLLPTLPFPTRYAAHTTQIISPQPKEQLWHNLVSSCRQKIRAAQNEDLIVFVGEPEELALLMMDTFRRRKVPYPLARMALAKTLTTLVNSGLCHIKGIKHRGGQSLSMRMVARDKTRNLSYDIAAGSTEGLRGGAGNLLLWEEITEEAALGQTLDLVGTGVSGVADFKRSFGGVEKRYTVMEMFSDRVSEMRYRLGRRLGMLK
jgi:hypothetical protein